MHDENHTRGLRRRSVLLGAAGLWLANATQAGEICTPGELARRYRATVREQIEVSDADAWIYGGLAETELAGAPGVSVAPQYMLVVDSCPSVQAAFLFWRLVPGDFELLGASPVSTGLPQRPGCMATPCGVFAHAQEGRGQGAGRVYDFGVQRARRSTGGFAPLRLQARSAQGTGVARLGTQQSDGCVLLPPSLIAFLDAEGVLDGGARGVLPFAGRHLVVVDSERDDRPDWAWA